MKDERRKKRGMLAFILHASVFILPTRVASSNSKTSALQAGNPGATPGRSTTGPVVYRPGHLSLIQAKRVQFPPGSPIWRCGEVANAAVSYAADRRCKSFQRSHGLVVYWLGHLSFTQAKRVQFPPGLPVFAALAQMDRAARFERAGWGIIASGRHHCTGIV